ncbi:hypothetical protein N7447_008024 [Penicillium robsamsonii]|uniref:uncharacterized protein n=1 Tax=Penicillium robsamsonii TaxID=1792511 RepID=UPI002547159F|nr:uncharacterized protein N7447_008024 [Penicillium robsamsonii]KAJ5815791.1 hypothetical protein N7447_008024 [Penicillium robsamsonii]
MGSQSPRDSRKRAKYTQVACNECKRRKLKCSGGLVCVRCSRDQIPCVYNRPPSTSQETDPKDERENSRFQAVDKQLETLRREMRTLSARVHELEPPGPSPPTGSLHRILDAPRSPTYVGPTSAEFGLTRPRSSLSQAASIDDRGEELDLSTTAPSPAPSEGGEIAHLGLPKGVDETLRLVQVYEDTVGVMYPCIDLDGVRAYVLEFYRSRDSATASSSVLTASDQDWFSARDVQVLKILLATALLAESHGRSERAAQLADSVEDRFASRLKIAEVDMKEILILTLLSIFHSYRDDEVIAGRLIGMAVRGSTELGLHRQETWQKTGGVFPGELEWTWASRLFWCIYVLDRKCAFGTGLPFAIQDSDIDTDLPEPGHSTPYLTCMISHARLSTKIWGLVVGWPNRSQAATSDGCAYLDAQVQQWIHSIPSELRFDPTWRSPAGTEHTDRAMMLQVLLALQANQLRILVYRQNLLSDERIADNVTGASTAVETAKSTVHMLDYFSRVSNIYFQRPEPFNYFLLSALAALFLAVLHAPARFSHACRPEFYTAVDMVRRSATRARTSRRLQKILHGLKRIRLNLRWDSGRQSSIRGHPLNPKQEKEPSELQPHARSKLSSTYGIWDTTPGSTTIESAAAHCTPGLHETSGATTPQLSSNAFWPMSPGMVAGPESNVCEDLSSFFEIAGGFYFDPQIGSDSATGANVGLTPPGETRSPHELDAFHAEDEALTRVMAGLL